VEGELFHASRGRATTAVTAPCSVIPPHSEQRLELNGDGTVFLINELADGASSAQPYTVVTGWNDALKR